MKTVLIDVDGVVANFAEAFVEVVNEVLDRNHVESDIITYDFSDSLGLDDYDWQVLDRTLGSIGLAEGLDTYPGAVEGVRSLMGVAEVYFVTSILKVCSTWTYDRTQWLKKLFGDAVEERIVFTDQKQLVQGDIFIDDMPANVNKWAKHNRGVAVLWEQRHNLTYRRKLERASITPKQARITITDCWNHVIELASASPTPCGAASFRLIEGGHNEG